MTTLTLRNARVWTADPSRPDASALVIRDGRIVALDDGGASDAIDARGRVVTPGLIDAHMHLLSGGESLTELDLSRVDSRDAFEAAIADRHAALPPDRWLVAWGWSNERWGGAPPDRSWLAPAGDRPVVARRCDLHAALVNDAVLAMIDTTREIANGEVVRDANDAPTGLLVEAAAWELVNPIVPSLTPADKQAALVAAQALCHARGLTAVGSMEYSRSLEQAYVPLRDRLTLRCRITLLNRGWPMSFDDGLAFDNDEKLAVIGYKAFADGTLGSRTARMLAPYDDDPGNRGTLVEIAAEGRLRDWAQGVAEAGLSPSIHAIGDEAARLVLDAVEGLPDSNRPRLEHFQQLATDDIARLADRIVSMQPLHKADDGLYVGCRMGRSRLAGTFAFRAIADAGARLAFGSDWPAVSPDPLEGVRVAVTGRLSDGTVFLPEQNLTVEESFHAYTTGAAYALGMGHAGVLRDGAYGDFVMYDKDPFTADWMKDPPRVVMTVVGGRTVYER